jgi:hypothetical protein
MSHQLDEGDFCYVDLVGRGTFEGTVVSVGKDYEIRLKATDEVVTAPNSEVWTAPKSLRV